MTRLSLRHIQNCNLKYLFTQKIGIATCYNTALHYIASYWLMQGINLQCNTALHHITSHCTTIASYYIHCTAIRVGQHQSETVHYPRTCIIRNCIAFLVWRYIALHSTGLQIYRNCTAFKVRQHQSETVHYPQVWYGAMHCICMYHAVQDIVQDCIHYTKLRCSVSH